MVNGSSGSRKTDTSWCSSKTEQRETKRSGEQAIKIDMAFCPRGNLTADAAAICHAETMGFDAAWSWEWKHNPFFPLTIASRKSLSIGLGTQVVAFPRSPMITAQIAWDLARQSEGRFLLGLGHGLPSPLLHRTQAEWHDTIDQMREYIESLRAIWNTFQFDARLRYRGQHYQFRLMAPFFNPGANKIPDIPIFLTGSEPGLCQLAGEIGQGLHVPLLHTLPYLRDRILPAIRRGLNMAGRSQRDFAISIPLLIVSGTTEAQTEYARREAKELAVIWASALGADEVLSYGGWHEFRDRLKKSENTADRDTLWRFVTDDMLEEIAIVAESTKVAETIRERYFGIADRLSLIWKSTDLNLMQRVISDLRSLSDVSG